MPNTNDRKKFDSAEAAKKNVQVSASTQKMAEQVRVDVDIEVLEERIAPCRRLM